MLRTNLKPAALAGRRSTSRRAIAWSAVLVPVVVAGVVWISSSAPAPAAQDAPVAAAPTSPASAQVRRPSTPAASRACGGQATSAAEPMTCAGRAIGLVVPEELQTFMVATRTSDGRIVLEHAASRKAAPEKGRTRAAKARQTAAKESGDR
jgi:hypothetical protein